MTNKHKKEVERAVENYAEYILYKVDKEKSLQYFKYLQNKYSIKYYKKQMYSILKFLNHLGIEWTSNISLPKDPITLVKRIDTNDIIKTINHFNDSKHYIKCKALILLGSSSGLRAEELYQLNPENINLEERILYVIHNPSKKQSTKTGKSRISFFTDDARDAIHDYFDLFFSDKKYSKLFPQTTITHLFNEAPIRVKDLRKNFSQTWDRRGGPTSIKKILMGHSLKGDIDLQHYNAQSVDDLKSIYDKIMNS